MEGHLSEKEGCLRVTWARYEGGSPEERLVEGHLRKGGYLEGGRGKGWTHN